MWIEAEPVYGALVSLAIGLIIGLERGWQVRQLGDNQRIAGMRTYGLIGLLGGVCALLLPTLGAWLALLGLLAVVAGCGHPPASDRGRPRPGRSSDPPDPPGG